MRIATLTLIAFGAMSVPAWLDFFLLHEAHHLYVAMGGLAEARHRR